jgi:hypothetical protein
MPLNKRPMGHIAHLSNLGPYKNIICISFPFSPFDPWGPMILINLSLFYIRKLSCQIQLFLASWFLRIRFLNDLTTFLHFCDYIPFEQYLALYLNKLEFPSFKDNLC